MDSLAIEHDQGCEAPAGREAGNRAMGRLQAFVIHLMISCVVVLAFLVVMTQIWYPDFFFEASAGWGVLRILVLVDLVLGPLVTLIIFKAGKPGLKFDLAVIAALQVTALLYGGSIIYQHRPGYLVFAVDRFEVIPAPAVDEAAIPYSVPRRAAGKPVPLVYSSLPDDPEARDKILFDVLAGGADVELRPELYRPFDENFDKVYMKSVDIELLINGDEEAAKRVREFVAAKNAELGDFLYFPLIGKNKDMLIVFAPSGGQPLGVIDINPWLS